MAIKMPLIIRLILATIITLALQSAALAQTSHDTPESFKVGNLDSSLNLAQSVVLLKDTQRQHDLASVLALPSSAWRHSSSDSLNLGYADSAWWVRLSLDNDSYQRLRFVLHVGWPLLDLLDVYLLQDGKLLSSWTTGDQRAFATRPIETKAFAFPFDIGSQESREIILRLDLRDGAYDLIPLHLWTPAAYFAAEQTKNLWMGAYFGAITALFIYILFLFISTRELNFLFYAAYLGTFAIWSFGFLGFGFQYLWTDFFWWNNQFGTGTAVPVILCATLFVTHALKTRQHAPLLHRALWTLSLLELIPMLMVIADSLGVSVRIDWFLYFYIAVLIPLITLYPVTALVLLSRGHKNALYFALAWFCVILGVLTYQALQIPGLIPENVITQNSILIGSTLEILLLSLAVGDNFRLIKTEKIAAERRTFELQSQHAAALEVQVQRTQELQADIEQLRQAEQERLERAIDVRTRQLRDSLRGQNLLLARISHDLRAPLQGVIGYARQLLDPSRPRDECARNIERGAQQQLELIDELLDYSRNELKQMELLVAPGYLFGFLDETAEQGRFLAESNRNRLLCQFAADLPPLVNADFRRLRQILVNLLANAAKFTRDGLIELQVSHLPGTADGQVRLQFAVADTGIGIALADHDRLQEPFSRGSNAEQHEGSGLGLYIVRQMLEAMGSVLQIDAAESGGSRFSFNLDLELAAEQELEQVFIESHGSHPAGQDRRVLIVDDASITREMLYELLAGHGYDPIACATGTEALAMLDEQRIELMISDQMMPDMDGWTLLESVRKRGQTLPVLLYSAAPPRRPPHLPDALAFDASLLKPADSAELLATLEVLLGNRTASEPQRSPTPA